MRIQLTKDSMQLIRNSGNFKVEFCGGFDYKVIIFRGNRLA